MFSSIYTALMALVGFSFLIFIHELGHFLAAKWIGVRVEAFSLGFGPYLGRKWKGTEYRLSLIPLGGYVKMAGEEPEADRKPEADEFYGKKVGQRSLVFAAGVFMNIVFGYLIFITAYQVGVPVVPAVVGDVVHGSPAWRAGLQRGDIIESIDNISPPVDFEDLYVASVLSSRGESVSLGIVRDGEKLSKEIFPKYIPELGAPSAGILQQSSMTVGKTPRSFEEIPEEGAQDPGAIFRAGLKEGDVITSLKLASDEAPRPITNPYNIEEILINCDGKPVEIGFTRDGVEQQPVTVQPRRIKGRRFIGVAFGSNVISETRPESWAQAAGLREEDVIQSVNGTPTPTQSKIADALDTLQTAPVTLEVQRSGETISILVPSQPDNESPASDIVFVIRPIVNELRTGSPAEKAGIKVGDQIVAVNGTNITETVEVSEAVLAADKDPVEMTWIHNGEKMTAMVQPEQPWNILIQLAPTRETIKAGLGGSIRLGTRKATQWIFRIYATIRGLLTGRISGRNLNGFIGIGVITFSAARLGFGYFLYILGLLSVNLGVVNLLPIPVFDGGHLLFALFEKIRGKVVPERIRTAASYVGLALILALVCLTFWNDISMFILKR